MDKKDEHHLPAQTSQPLLGLQLPLSLLGTFLQHFHLLNGNRGFRRIGPGLYLDVVSLVLGNSGWICHCPDLVVSVGDDDELRSVGNMLFVRTLLISMSGALRIAYPALQRCRLRRLTAVGNEYEGN